MRLGDVVVQGEVGPPSSAHSSSTALPSAAVGYRTWSLTRMPGLSVTPWLPSKMTLTSSVRPFFSIAPVAAIDKSSPHSSSAARRVEVVMRRSFFSSSNCFSTSGACKSREE